MKRVLVFLILLLLACVPREKTHFERGYIYANMGKYEDALAEYKQALEEDSLDHKIHYALGFVYSEMEMCEQTGSAMKGGVPD
jgi:tetratricopeptide (TPR) repeat protein